MTFHFTRRRVAVIGSGVSGLSAAWLMSGRCDVTLFEADSRIGGHAHTVDIDGPSGPCAVDTGFIVYNEVTYPNLTALFAHLGIESRATDMSFAVSVDDGRLEYSGGSFAGLFVQKRNFLRPRFYVMLRDIVRFYREAPVDLSALGGESLDAYLDRRGYGRAFRDDHLYPMAAAIWSTPAGEIGRYPAASFIRFCENHGLLKIVGRPLWRTVAGGSRAYVERLAAPLAGRIREACPVVAVARKPDGVMVTTADGNRQRFDDVVLAVHADQALRLIERPAAAERRLLSAFRFTSNEAVLHGDHRMMPRRRAAWSAWNYLARSDRHDQLAVSYWMNRLQGLDNARDLFVTLNPLEPPAPDTVLWQGRYEHPLFDADALAAQRGLWALQGEGGLWFAGAWLGAGFHEDGLQAGLAVAEAISGARRPWSVPESNGRLPANDLRAPVLRALP